ncbi:hypothetical protein [Nitratireductor basaltis]|uniref:hypothetical protein n=1 Tax=Nitratireductor basaltis TaxID=472175 RepID=UPI001378A6BF|nr:hypothetical protein [Nitratireductor basaltis]
MTGSPHRNDAGVSADHDGGDNPVHVAEGLGPLFRLAIDALGEDRLPGFVAGDCSESFWDGSPAVRY